MLHGAACHGPPARPVAHSLLLFIERPHSVRKSAVAMTLNEAAHRLQYLVRLGIATTITTMRQPGAKAHGSSFGSFPMLPVSHAISGGQLSSQCQYGQARSGAGGLSVARTGVRPLQQLSLDNLQTFGQVPSCLLYTSRCV